MAEAPDQHLSPNAASRPYFAGLSRTQLFILLGLTSLLVLALVGALGLLFMTRSNEISGPQPPPAGVIARAPTSTPYAASAIPTYAYRATITPIPTATGFEFHVPSRIPPTRTPVPAALPPARPGRGSTCQAALDYEASVHDYYVTYYRNYYEPWFDYYNRLIDYAARTGDALMLAQAQAGLKEAKADLQSYLNQENKRHNKEVASIKAYCP